MDNLFREARSAAPCALTTDVSVGPGVEGMAGAAAAGRARAAARKAQVIEQRRAEGLSVHSSAGALSDGRREQLEDIDPSWSPSRPVE